ncbi:MAG: ABC transporter ATP-binding protein [Coriobacteriales bacterium]|nr:ABC transporter ATP-binding protein [Coriobacteriales bacterium]
MSIKVENLSFSYGKHEVLHELNFEIKDGMLVNVLGPNGVGKSTLFRCLLGLNKNYSGNIFINEKNLKTLNTKQKAKEIAYIPQSHQPIYDYEVLDVVLMSTTNDLPVLGTPKKEQIHRAYNALEKIGIEKLATRTYTEISGGEQQLVLIARAIAQEANTIIMDEPTSALDYGNTVRVLNAVKALAAEGMSIVQSTHQPDQAFLYSDKTLVIYDKRVRAFGTPKEVVTKDLIGDIYDIDVEVKSLYDDKIRVCVPICNIEGFEKV